MVSSCLRTIIHYARTSERGREDRRSTKRTHSTATARKLVELNDRRARERKVDPGEGGMVLFSAVYSSSAMYIDMGVYYTRAVLCR